jgi:hypothetical protein
LQRPRQAGDSAESQNQITRKQVCSKISMETDISNSFSLEAMQIVSARAIFADHAKLRCAPTLTMQELAAAKSGRLMSA